MSAKPSEGFIWDESITKLIAYLSIRTFGRFLLISKSCQRRFSPSFLTFLDDILLDIIFRFPYLEYCIQYTPSSRKWDNLTYNRHKMKNTSGSKLKFELGEIKPLRDKIVSSIRDAIIEGRIKAGERLMEPDVARNLGVSRTPLREAFLQLESEGFVKVTPRRGAVVSELSVKDAEETYVIKSALEGLAARLAVKNMTEELLQQLRSLNNEMEKKSKQKDKDYRAILDLNAKYHYLMNKASGNEKLCHSINLLRKQTLRYNYIYLNVLSHIDQSIQEHKAIIDALEQRDQKLTEKLVYNHGENAGKILCEYIQTISHADAKA